MRLARTAVAGILLCALRCAGTDTAPAALDTKNETCRFCRMPVSDPKLAAQLAAPGEEHRFFDDIGCLRGDLARSGPPAGAVAYVADHRTGTWVSASRAVFSRCPAIETPMGSHLIAHSNEASRAADPSAAGCATIAASDIFGPSGPPGSRGGG